MKLIKRVFNSNKKTFPDKIRIELIRDVLILISLAIITLLASEWWLNRNQKVNYYQRLNTYFYLLLPVLVGVTFIYFYLRRLQAGKIKPGRSIRYKLFQGFFLVAILPSMPLFFLSSDIIQRGLTDFLDINIAKIQNIHRDSLRLIYKPRLKKILKEKSHQPCSMFQYTTKCRVAYKINNSYHYTDSKAKEYHNFYTKFLNATNNSPEIEFLVFYPENEMAELLKNQTFKNEKVLAVLHNGKTIERLYFFELTDDEKKLFFQGEKFNQRYQFVTSYQAPIQVSIDVFLTILFVLIIILAVVMAYYISHGISDPIISMAQSISKLVAKDLVHFKKDLTRISKGASPGEIKILADSYITMLDELEKYREEQYQIQKSSAWQEVAQQLAHEIKNPLTPMQLFTQRIRLHSKKNKDALPANLYEIIDNGSMGIMTQIETIKTLIDSFSKLARMPTAHRENFDIKNLISDLKKDSYTQEFKLSISDVKNKMIFADIAQVKQVMVNLLQNAVRALKQKNDLLAEEKHHFSPQIILASKQTKNGYFLIIEDNGIGIAPSLKEKIFQPNIFGKGGGDGLGLSIVRRILEDHGFTIRVESKYKSWSSYTRFIIFLPENK